MTKDIFIIAEHLKGKLCDITFEMLGQARVITNQTGGRVVAILCGKNIKALGEQLGIADLVMYNEHDQLAEFNPESYQLVITDLIKEHNPWLILIGSTTFGLDVASSLSAKLGISMTANCRDLFMVDSQLIAVGQLYGGKMFVKMNLQKDQLIISVLPGSFRADAGRSDAVAKIENVQIKTSLDSLRIKFEQLIEPEAGDIDITQSQIIISVGRGIQSQDNLTLAQELADALGGVVAASRPVVDQGWLPMTRQVGRSGMIVKPKLYLALGISGAPEHIEGMRDSDLVIAVNTDAQAPIFDTAKYGAVTDVLDFIPAMTEAIKKQKASV